MELDFGGESGSERMQRLVCKDVSAGQILDSTAKLAEFAPSVDPFVSWLSGLPGETYADMEQTFDLMDAMRRANPRTQHYGIFLYTPFPSPLLEHAARRVHLAAVARGLGGDRGLPLRAALAHEGLRRASAGDLGGDPLRVLSALAHRRARTGFSRRLRSHEPRGALPVETPLLRSPGRTEPRQRRGQEAARLSVRRVAVPRRAAPGLPSAARPCPRSRRGGSGPCGR